MLFIIDKKIPSQAKITLSEFGEIIEFSSTGITYEAISGHPDIFFFQIENQLIIAKNTPEKFVKILEKKQIDFKFSNGEIGLKYPQTAILNGFYADGFLVHNFSVSDPAMLEISTETFKVSVKQGYCRCNILKLGDCYLTTDTGIYKALKINRKDIVLISPDGIVLPGFQNGFIGGAAGWNGDKLFLIGSLKHYCNGDILREIAEKQHIEIIELYDGPLFDGGGVLIIEE